MKVLQFENDIVNLNEEESNLMKTVQKNEVLLNELLRPFEKFKEAIRNKRDNVKETLLIKRYKIDFLRVFIKL